jgi:hypothetical protein
MSKTRLKLIKFTTEQLFNELDKRISEKTGDLKHRYTDRYNEMQDKLEMLESIESDLSDI